MFPDLVIISKFKFNIANLMGNFETSYTTFILPEHKWKQIPTTRNLMVNTQTKKIASFYQLQQVDNNTIQSFIFRANNQQYLVGFYGIIYNKQDTSCFLPSAIAQKIGKLSHVKILIPNIQYRLCDLGGLSLQQGMYIANQWINGLKIITQKYGDVIQNIQQEQIGVNQNGQCKFWVHQNYFQSIDKCTGNKMSQRQLVEKILAIIQGRMQPNILKQQKKQYYTVKTMFKNGESYNGLNFVNALKFIEAVCKMFQINLKKARIDIPNLQNPQRIISYLEQQKSSKKADQKLQRSKQKIKNRISLKNKSTIELTLSRRCSKQKYIQKQKQNQKQKSKISTCTIGQKTKNAVSSSFNNMQNNPSAANSRLTKLSQQTVQSQSQIKHKFSIKNRTYRRVSSYNSSS